MLKILLTCIESLTIIGTPVVREQNSLNQTRNSPASFRKQPCKTFRDHRDVSLINNTQENNSTHSFPRNDAHHDPQFPLKFPRNNALISNILH